MSCLSSGSDKMDILEYDPDVYLGVMPELWIWAHVGMGCAKWLPGPVKMLRGEEATVRVGVLLK